MTLLETAIAYRKAGRDAIAVEPRAKYPIGINDWQTHVFTDDELREYIEVKGWGIGIRNQEGLDFDNSAGEAEESLNQWKELVNSLAPGLVDRLLIERTQHGGFHVPWKCEVIEGNQKLASRLPTDEESQKNPKIKSVTFIETRGLGGQIVASPTPGYTLIQGDWCNLLTISPEERQILLQCARSLDKVPAETYKPEGPTDESGDRPGDIFNEEGHEEVLAILKESHWDEVYRRAGTVYLRRPGKDRGISATFGYVAPGIFYNFSSNGTPFDPGKAYTPFAVSALLKYDGNFSQAASDLAKRYGLNSSKEDNQPMKRFTDTSNAELLAFLYGDKVRFDHKRTRWLTWKRHRWQPDNNGSINRLAVSAARERYKRAIDVQDPEVRTMASKWAIKSESKMRLDACIGIAKNLPPIADAGENWDKNPMLLCCPNGVVDLTTGQLRAGQPEDRITMSTKVMFDPEAKCPRWEQFLREIFEWNEELIHFLQKALGYSLTGDTKEQVVFLCHGNGANGKSTLFNTVNELMGDYGHTAPASLFQRNPLKTNSNDIAALEFKRLLISSEVLSNSRLDEAFLKRWSGEDKITARFLYNEYFSFYPTCKVWFYLNHKPQIEDDSYALWRRMRLIPFNRKFSPAEQDLDLSKKLAAEMPGILNWLVKGCLLWQKEGLKPVPEIVSAATQDYRQENDILYEFQATMCEEREGAEIKASDLYKAYVVWAEWQGLKREDVLKNQPFGCRMGDKFTKKPKNDGTYYLGLALKTDKMLPKSGGYDRNSVPSGGYNPDFNKPLIQEPSQSSLLENGSNPPPERPNGQQSTTRAQTRETEPGDRWVENTSNGARVLVSKDYVLKDGQKEVSQ